MGETLNVNPMNRIAVFHQATKDYAKGQSEKAKLMVNNLGHKVIGETAGQKAKRALGVFVICALTGGYVASPAMKITAACCVTACGVHLFQLAFASLIGMVALLKGALSLKSLLSGSSSSKKERAEIQDLTPKASAQKEVEKLQAASNTEQAKLEKIFQKSQMEAAWEDVQPQANDQTEVQEKVLEDLWTDINDQTEVQEEVLEAVFKEVQLEAPTSVARSIQAHRITAELTNPAEALQAAPKPVLRPLVHLPPAHLLKSKASVEQGFERPKTPSVTEQPSQTVVNREQVAVVAESDQASTETMNTAWKEVVEEADLKKAWEEAVSQKTAAQRRTSSLLNQLLTSAMAR